LETTNPPGPLFLPTFQHSYPIPVSTSLAFGATSGPSSQPIHSAHSFGSPSLPNSFPGSAMPSPLMIPNFGVVHLSVAPSPGSEVSALSSAASSKRPRLMRHSSSVSMHSRHASLDSRYSNLDCSSHSLLWIPFRWVDDPEWHEFCQDFIPNAVLFDRKSLANTHIPAEAHKFREAANMPLRPLN
jgi:hypothetical protein